MTRSIRTSSPAAEELREAVGWYELHQPGLGGKLFEAVAETVQLIERHPEIGKPFSRKTATRQLLVQGFPYQIVYHVTQTDITIIAVAHLKRRPGYWRGRT